MLILGRGENHFPGLTCRSLEAFDSAYESRRSRLNRELNPWWLPSSFAPAFPSRSSLSRSSSRSASIERSPTTLSTLNTSGLRLSMSILWMTGASTRHTPNHCASVRGEPKRKHEMTTEMNCRNVITDASVTAPKQNMV